jgi:hypothetical protein
MERKIKIFRSFEEQEKYHLEMMRQTTPAERLRSLYLMQQLSQRLHPAADNTRKIIIRNGYSKQ